MSRRDQALIADWGERLHANALALRILASLNERKSEVERCALDGLQRENRQFAPAANPQFRAEALGHCNDILQLMLAVAAAEPAMVGSEPFRFVEHHAERRARQQFPLAGSLNAYRLAHKGYWEVMRDSVAACAAAESEKTDCLMVLSEFLLEFFDRISGVMTDAYIAAEKTLAARRTRTQAALIEDLLHGRQPGDLETQALCAATGIGDSEHLAVAIARAGHAGNGPVIDRAGRLARLAESIREALARADLRGLTDIRKDDVVAIIAGEADTSARAAQALRRIAPELDDGCGIGVGMDAAQISALPQACQEAERAVEFTAAGREVMAFGEIDLMEFLVRRPDAAARRLIPPWASRLKEEDGGKAEALSHTIRQFAACNLNVKHTARNLNLHTNTVYFRLNRVRKLTGIDPRSYAGLSLLLTAMQMLEAAGSTRAPRR